jgi:hypothetical protein
MAIIADFCLVWLPAPRLPLDGNTTTNTDGDATSATYAVQQYLANMPSNAFQVSRLRVLPSIHVPSVQGAERGATAV